MSSSDKGKSLLIPDLGQASSTKLGQPSSHEITEVEEITSSKQDDISGNNVIGAPTDTPQQRVPSAQDGNKNEDPSVGHWCCLIRGCQGSRGGRGITESNNGDPTVGHCCYLIRGSQGSRVGRGIIENNNGDPTVGHCCYLIRGSQGSRGSRGITENNNVDPPVGHCCCLIRASQGSRGGQGITENNDVDPPVGHCCCLIRAGQGSTGGRGITENNDGVRNTSSPDAVIDQMATGLASAAGRAAISSVSPAGHIVEFEMQIVLITTVHTAVHFSLGLPSVPSVFYPSASAPSQAHHSSFSFHQYGALDWINTLCNYLSFLSILTTITVAIFLFSSCHRRYPRCCAGVHKFMTIALGATYIMSGVSAITRAILLYANVIFIIYFSATFVGFLFILFACYSDLMFRFISYGHI